LHAARRGTPPNRLVDTSRPTGSPPCLLRLVGAGEKDSEAEPVGADRRVRARALTGASPFALGRGVTARQVSQLGNPLLRPLLQSRRLTRDLVLAFTLEVRHAAVQRLDELT